MLKTIQAMRIRDERGFTLIELLIVVAIIGILAATAIPGYLGMQERSRKGSVIRAASAAEPDVMAWLNSALRGLAAGTSTQGALYEVDSNGDGQVNSTDSNNSGLGALLAAGNLCSQYVSAKEKLQGEQSPWAATSGHLWVSGAAASGKISCSTSQNGASYDAILTAEDGQGNTINIKTLYSD